MIQPTPVEPELHNGLVKFIHIINKPKRFEIDAVNNMIIRVFSDGSEVVRPIIKDREPCVCGSGSIWKLCCKQKLKKGL